MRGSRPRRSSTGGLREHGWYAGLSGLGDMMACTGSGDGSVSQRPNVNVPGVG